MPVDALTDLAHVAAWMGLTSPQASGDAVLTDLIPDVCAAFLQEIGRTSLLSASYTERRNGNGKPQLSPKVFPVTAVASVVIQNYSVPASPDGVQAGFVFDDKSIFLVGAPLGVRVGATFFSPGGFMVFPKGYSNVVLTYTAGFAGVPGDVRRAVTQWVAHIHRGGSRIGERSKTFEHGQTTAYDISSMPDFTARVVEQYKNRGMAGY